MKPQNAKAPKKKQAAKADARVVRTRNQLGNAIIELMQQRPFEEITVQHVLDRAGVSRSTFYAHYTGKEDLFIADVDEFWEGMSTLPARRGEASNRVAPVRELLEHAADMGDFQAALRASGKVHDVMELGRGHFARGIEARLRDMPQARNVTPASRAALAQMFAGALFSLLDRWLSSRTNETAEQLDDLYHQMVWGSLGASSASKPEGRAVPARPSVSGPKFSRKNHSLRVP
jgi:AcrR family transcriptional regulator